MIRDSDECSLIVSLNHVDSSAGYSSPRTSLLYDIQRVHHVSLSLSLSLSLPPSPSPPPGSDTTGIPPIIDILNTLKVPVYAYVLFLVAVGVILSTICLAFNIIYRNKKYINIP